ncbi:MAG: hypothetical protein KF709_08710 [Gemmatimonadaceae bacterium]|nr:hypothetical protein [Gemmatimonadaceae bacterium]
MRRSDRSSMAAEHRLGDCIVDDGDAAAPQASVDDSWLNRISGNRAQVVDAPRHLNGGILAAV